MRPLSLRKTAIRSCKRYPIKRYHTKVETICLVILTAILVGWGVGAGHAATFEVARSGDDANAGTTERPLKSIGKALTLAHAGDTVLIHGGTYREGLLRP